MAKPIINNTSSVLGFLQWEEFHYQMFAYSSDAVTAITWTASALPEGVTLSAGGLFEGPASKPGVYIVAVTAHQGADKSDPVIFTFGIEASAGDPAANVIDLSVDVASREVTNYVGEVAESLFSVKYRDNLFLRVRFHKAQTPANLTFTGLKFTMKELETEGIIVESLDADFDELSPGVCLIYVNMDDPEVQQALYNYETEKKTEFKAICELEWKVSNSLGFPVALTSVRGSSKNFGATIIRDLGQIT